MLLHIAAFMTLSDSVLARYGPYDRILVDAPCSSDRHLLHGGAAGLANWSPATPKKHAARQTALLRASLGLAKTGGKILYVTCALSDTENDQVIRQLIASSRGKAKVVQVVSSEVASSLSIGISTADCRLAAASPEEEGEGNKWHLEPTDYGARMLPDRSKFGPLYFCMIEKM